MNPENGPQPNRLEQVSAELGVSVSASFRGAHIFHKGTEGFNEQASVFLVEDANRTRFALKLNNIHEGEVDKTNQMRKWLEGSPTWHVPEIVSSRPSDYIMSRFLSGRPVGLEDVWRRQDLMNLVMPGFAELDERINQEPLDPELVEKGKQWVWSKLTKDWVEPILNDPTLTHGGLITPGFITDIQAYEKNHAPELEDIRRAYRDPNGDHIIELRDVTGPDSPKLGLVDIDFQPRPKGYGPPRFLAWSLLRIGSEDPIDSEAWVKKMRAKYSLGAEMDPTFVLSLTGILYDLATSEKGNKDKRIIAISVKDIINSIIKKDGSSKKTAK